MAPMSALYTPTEVAGLFIVSPETIRRWARNGKINAVKMPGGRVMFRRSEIDAMVADLTGEQVSA